MVLIGIGVNDTANDLAYVAGKILALRLFPEQGHEDWGWKKSVVDAEFEVLCGESSLLPPVVVIVLTARLSLSGRHGCAPQALTWC